MVIDHGTVAAHMAVLSIVTRELLNLHCIVCYHFCDSGGRHGNCTVWKAAFVGQTPRLHCDSTDSKHDRNICSYIEPAWGMDGEEKRLLKAAIRRLYPKGAATDVTPKQVTQSKARPVHAICSLRYRDVGCASQQLASRL